MEYKNIALEFKVTRHFCFKKSKNLRPQDILTFNYKPERVEVANFGYFLRIGV